MPIVNINEMLKKALEEHYAVLHANVVNYDMAKAVILAAQEVKSPIIVAVSEKALKGFVSPKDFVELVKNIVYQSHITVPVAMHLDHGEYETVISAMESGFTSVMYDGSKLPIKTNIQNTNEIVSLAHAKNISVECEVGTITGKKEDQGAEGQLANVMDAQLMAKTGIDALAAGIGNLHGEYPQDWQGLNLVRLKEIHQALPHLPLVLHGGSGIPNDQVRQAIELGVCKFNVGTELLTAFSGVLADYFIQGKHQVKHGYDPRLYIPQGLDQVKKVVIQKIMFLGAHNKA